MSLSLRAKAHASRLTALRQSRTKGRYPILWVSDSIFNMDTLQAGVEAALAASYDATGARATYGGNTIGSGLFELADVSYAFVNGAWQACVRGLPFSHFQALIFEFGRNELNTTYGPDAYQKAYDKLLAQGLNYLPHVVTSNCPPLGASGLADWDADDFYDDDEYRAACAAVATKWGQRHYDLYSDFLELVDEETYTVAQLMRDVGHPTYDIGAARIAAQLATLLFDFTAKNDAEPEIEGEVRNYIFGEPTSGTWALADTTNLVGPTQGPLPRVAGLADQGLRSVSSGAKLTFPTVTVNEGGQVWCRFYGQTGGGGFEFFIDRGTPEQIVGSFTTSIISNNYPHAFLIADDLAAGPHTFELQKAANTDPLVFLGMTVVGAVAV